MMLNPLRGNGGHHCRDEQAIHVLRKETKQIDSSCRHAVSEKKHSDEITIWTPALDVAAGEAVPD